MAISWTHDHYGQCSGTVLCSDGIVTLTRVGSALKDRAQALVRRILDRAERNPPSVEFLSRELDAAGFQEDHEFGTPAFRPEAGALELVPLTDELIEVELPELDTEVPLSVVAAESPNEGKGKKATRGSK